MTDDIVTRLRNSCRHACVGCLDEDSHVVGLEAADEIERLRAELAEERRESRRLARELDMEDFGESDISDESL